jgi:hypothetical protein
MTSNQPASLRREKMSLGHQHLELSGKIQAQEAHAQRVSANLLGVRADVTQATSIVTGVEANGRFGVITTFASASTALGVEEEAFVFTNKYLSATSVLLLSVQYTGTTLGVPSVYSRDPAEGSTTIVLVNTGSAATDALIKIHYMILGAAPDQGD